MDNRQLPTFMVLSGQISDHGSELLVNLNQVRIVEIRGEEASFHFSKEHVLNAHGNVVPEILAFLRRNAVMTNGVPFAHAKGLKSESQSEPSQHS